MGGASPVLRRLAAPAALLAVLVAYYIWHDSVPELPSLWWNVAFLGLVLVPSVFLLVLFALPLRDWKWLLPTGLGLLAAGFLFQWLDAGLAANFSKLGAMTALGFWFVSFFEAVTWVVLVAVIVPWVDAYSVWRGPTNHIVNKQPEVFTTLSFAFPVPGRFPPGFGVARLGLPDLFFFALFLAAADRFGLRTRVTWLAMALSFGATIALAQWWQINGLPALPMLALGFLAPNADLIYRAIRPSESTP